MATRATVSAMRGVMVCRERRDAATMSRGATAWPRVTGLVIVSFPISLYWPPSICSSGRNVFLGFATSLPSLREIFVSSSSDTSRSRYAFRAVMTLSGVAIVRSLS